MHRARAVHRVHRASGTRRVGNGCSGLCRPATAGTLPLLYTLSVTLVRHTWPLPPGRYHLSCDGRHAGGLGGSRGIFLWGWSDQRTGSTARSPDGCAICQVRRVTSSRQRVPPRTLLVTHAWAHAWDARLLCNTGAERTPAHASPSRVRSRRPRVAHSLDGRLGRQKVGIARRRFAAGGARQQ